MTPFWVSVYVSFYSFCCVDWKRNENETEIQIQVHLNVGN